MSAVADARRTAVYAPFFLWVPAVAGADRIVLSATASVVVTSYRAIASGGVTDADVIRQRQIQLGLMTGNVERQ